MMFSMESSPLEGEVWHIVEEYYAIWNVMSKIYLNIR